MSQSRKMSFVERSVDMAAGFALSLATLHFIVAPLFDLPIPLSENVAITLIFTAVSLVRGYFFRRLFNRIGG